MENKKRLKHIRLGVEGEFIKTYFPTGKPETTIIMLDNGKAFFAPSCEFITINNTKNIIRKINKENYFNNTKGRFVECERPKKEPDFVSTTGSKYWYIRGGVIRQSSHWSNILYTDKPTYDQYANNVCGMIKNCYWDIFVITPMKLSINGNYLVSKLFEQVKKGRINIKEVNDFFNIEGVYDNTPLCGKIKFSDLKQI